MFWWNIKHFCELDEMACEVAANFAWYAVLSSFGTEAWNSTRKDGIPYKCKTDCYCAPNNYNAEFNWSNNTVTLP